jgi:hypothetical protein
MKRLIATCAVAAAALFAAVAPVSANPAAASTAAQPAPVPTASQLCSYGSLAIIPYGGETVLFAQYETLNTTYAEARCLVSWPVQGGHTYIVCGFRERVYSNGAWAGPYGRSCS